MKISVIGSGYVGITTAIMFCELGYKVTGVDTDERKLALLRSGQLPIYEPGLEKRLPLHLAKGNLAFTDDTKDAVEEADVIYIAVGTPANPDGSCDLTYVREAAQAIGRYQNGYKIVVNKSTVPIGTGEKVKRWILENQKHPYPVDIVSNPEFLREGTALRDALSPDRIVIGAERPAAAEMIKSLFADIDCPKIVTNLRTAEMIKYSANAFLATKISFINEIGRLCDVYGANVDDVALGIGLDRRIGSEFLRAGIGWGGSCFPKDLAALIAMSERAGVETRILKAVREVNTEQVAYYLARLEERLGGLRGKRVSLLGVSFKPDTDDIREAPAITVIKRLLACGASVRIYDPVAAKHVKLEFPAARVCKTAEEALAESDCAFLMTEWKEFLSIDWKKAYAAMRTPLVIDGRNFLDRKFLEGIGYRYYGIGRGNGVTHG
ncbi:UDP-glucose/GDP-mannose dehydrogenase family protein [Bacillaceae bacterium]